MELSLQGQSGFVYEIETSTDLQFLGNRKFSCTEICSAFGVPEEIITTTNAAKYDVMLGARLNFIENRVVPLCRRLEAEDDVTVKAIDPKADGWFDPEDHPAELGPALELCRRRTIPRRSSMA